VTHRESQSTTSGPDLDSSLNARFFPRSGPILFTVPIIGFVAAIISGSLTLLDYVHVMTGGMWTGIDLFMGIFGRTVMMKISPPSRVEIAKRLTPTMLFLMPSIAAVATTAGYILANKIGVWNSGSPYITATIIVVFILLVQGFGILLPNELRVFREIRKERPDTDKIVKLSIRNLNVSGSQAIFQIIIIYIMANLTI
jgi:hypothetical protein